MLLFLLFTAVVHVKYSIGGLYFGVKNQNRRQDMGLDIIKRVVE